MITLFFPLNLFRPDKIRNSAAFPEDARNTYFVSKYSLISCSSFATVSLFTIPYNPYTKSIKEIGAAAGGMVRWIFTGYS